MRMAPHVPLTASHVLNTYSVGRLSQLFRAHADLSESHALARRIAYQREKTPLTTTLQLRQLLKGLAPLGSEQGFFARVFQAIRMEVNDELGALRDFLRQCAELIEEGGRLVVISYHSCEDRLVKRFFKHGNFSSTPDTDVYGQCHKPFHALARTPLLPDPAEIARNAAARSAKLRVGIKISSHGVAVDGA